MKMNVKAGSGRVRAALLLLVCVVGAESTSSAQGELSGGLGQFAVQPKKEKAVAKAGRRYERREAGAGSGRAGGGAVRPAGPAERLLEAASAGDVAGVEQALARGADMNAKSATQGCTALVFAAAA